MNIKPFGNEAFVFGFGTKEHIAERSLKYMDRRGITGRVLNLFEWGQYIIWRDFPKRMPFVDGRGHIPVELLESTTSGFIKSPVVDSMSEKYGFDVVLYRQEHLELSDKWALVYWDDKSSVYLKRGVRYDHIINKDEYRFVKVEKGYSYIKQFIQDVRYKESIINELIRNISESGASKAYAYLGFVYNDTGNYKEAIGALSMVKDIHLMPEVYYSMAYAYDKLNMTDKAVEYYKKSLSLMENASTFYNLAVIYKERGDKENAIKYLKHAMKTDPQYKPAYPLLIELYRDLGMNKEAKDLEKRFQGVEMQKTLEGYLKRATEAYREKKYDIAIEELQKSIQMHPSAIALSNLGKVYYDMGDIDKAIEYQKKAIDLDPSYPDSYFIIALAYKAQGQNDMVLRHMEEYLRLEPEGFFSRRAKEIIREIRR